ncbi:unnamed protein product [Lathyrus oleraceus]|uniref:Transmembrane protein n=1 Tax=Pisum sativum TaxID=3888 RepID=A0A9D5AAY0_PEA|nr:hypothetical protein KIW84_065883 [Pisum sativum]
MDTLLKSYVTFLTFILLVSFFVSLVPYVSEARPLFSPSQGNEGVIGDVNGVFRTLKGAGPSPGVGHRIKNLQTIQGMKHSGPSSGGVGHKLQVLGMTNHFGPSPGEGH